MKRTEQPKGQTNDERQRKHPQAQAPHPGRNDRRNQGKACQARSASGWVLRRGRQADSQPTPRPSPEDEHRAFRRTYRGGRCR